MSGTIQVGVLGGTGSEGRGLALRFALAGVPAGVGSRDRQRAEQAAASLNEQLLLAGTQASLQGNTNMEIAGAAEFIFLAVPFAHAVRTLAECASRMRAGSIVVDVTVPLVIVPGQRGVGLMNLAEGSGSRHLASHIPPGVDLVAAFKTLPAHLLNRPEAPLDCDEFVCGDSPEARRRTLELLHSFRGLRAIDAGGLDSAAALERMCALAVSLNRMHKVKGSRFRIVGL